MATLERMPIVGVRGVVVEVIDAGLDKEGKENDYEILLVHQKGLKDNLEVWAAKGSYAEGEIVDIPCQLSTWTPDNKKITLKFKNNMLN